MISAKGRRGEDLFKAVMPLVCTGVDIIDDAEASMQLLPQAGEASDLVGGRCWPLGYVRVHCIIY